MKKIRKIVSLLLTMAMLGTLLGGCGSGNEGKTLDEDGNVVVRIAVSGSATEEQVKTLIRGFQAQGNNISFKLENIVGDYTTKLVTQVSAGTAPDLIWISDTQVRQLASKGVLTDLSEYYDEMNINEDDIYESMLSTGMYEGKQYMIPRDYNHIVTYYNKALFDEAGVDYPTDGWTWEEFVDTAYKFPKKTGDIYTQRGCQAWLTWGATAPVILMGLGGTLTTPYPDGTSANFNTPGTVEALKEIKQLVDDGVLVNDYNNDIGNFNSGKVAMVFQTRSVLSSFIEAIGEENLGVTTFPVLPEQHIVGCGTSGYAIVSSSACKEEAAKFLAYTISEEGQRVFSETGDCVPVLKSMATDEVWRNSVPGIPAEPFLDSPECDILQPCITVANDAASVRFDTCWKNAFSGLLTGVYSVEEAAEHGQEEMESAFTRQ